MDKTPTDKTDQTDASPNPEALKPQDNKEQAPETPAAASGASADQLAKRAQRLHRGTYRPSHKATFIGLIVVVAILGINTGVIAFVIKAQSKSKLQSNVGQVTIDQAALDKLGVNRDSVGQSGVQLTVNPDARFNGALTVAGNVSVSGQLKLNNKFTAGDASFTQLEAGNTALSQLNVNGNSTFSNASLRNDLSVTGASHLQGAVTISQLLTVAGSVNVSGNLAVGGTLSVANFHTASLVSDGTVTIGGHVITRGLAPGVSAGPAIGTNGTVSISGNDAAGTVAVNTGNGAVSGVVANVAFRSPYSNIPHVVVSLIGVSGGSVYISRNAGGFSIGVNGLVSNAGYAFDYIVEQ